MGKLKGLLSEEEVAAAISVRRCPACDSPRTKVINVRDALLKDNGPTRRRRYKCRDCDVRWSTCELREEELGPRLQRSSGIKRPSKWDEEK